jgi:hypothetical protein
VLESSDESDADARREARALAQRAQDGDLSPAERAGVVALLASLDAELHDLSGEGELATIDAQFRAALGLATDTAAEQAVRLAVEWGRFAMRHSLLDSALEAFESAHRLSAALLAPQVTWEDRSRWLPYAQAVAVELPLALLRRGETRRAVEALDAGRRSILRAGLHGTDDDRRLLADTRPELVAELDQARTALREATLPDPGARGTEADTREAVRRARAHLVAVEEQARAALRTEGAPWSFTDIDAVAREEPIVYVASANGTGYVVVVDGSGDVRFELSHDMRSTVLVERLAAYLAATARVDDDVPRVPSATWRAALGTIADWLGEALTPAVLRLTDGHKAVRCVPVGYLGQLPLHVARRPDASAATGSRYLIDERRVTFVPGAASLGRRGRDGAQRPLRTAVVVESWDPSLDHAHVEGRYIGERLPLATSIIPAGAATRASVLAALRDADVAHLACHGIANLMHPLDSALLVGPDEHLSVRDLLADAETGLRLAVLSACQTATPGASLPDEAIGLPTALLAAGAQAAIGSMWAVPDGPTALLMARMYDFWREGYTPPEALRRAQQWIRDATNREHATRYPTLDGRLARVEPALRDDWERRRGFAHPDYWAAFVFFGTWPSDQPVR